MQCIIVDDDESVCAYLSNLITESGVLTLAGSFSDPEKAAMFLLTHNNIDLIFLDVEMPKLNGIEFITSLEQAIKDIFVVVVSSSEKYAIDAINKNVAAYILKPITLSNFLNAVKKVQRLYDSKHNIQDSNFFLKSNDGRYVKLSWDDIRWIEVNRNYLTLNTFDNTFTIQATLKDFVNKLPIHAFIKTHRSFVVNINHITTIEEHSIIIPTVKGDTKIPLSRNFKNEILTKINILNDKKA